MSIISLMRLSLGSAYSEQNVCDTVPVAPFISASWFGRHVLSSYASSVIRYNMKHFKYYPITLVCG